MLRSVYLGLLVAATLAANGAAAQPINEAFQRLQRLNAQGSLAALGIAGLPDDSASTIFLESGSQEREYDYRSAQLGGGFRLAESFPLYLEGYIGYARYDPVLLLTEGAQQSRIPLKWTSAAATGGIGWEFDLNEDWKLRPLVHLSLGRVQTDASVAAQGIANRLGLDADFLSSGGIWAGGLGGSLALAYGHRWDNDREYEMQLRYTHIEYRPIGDDEDLLISSTAANGVFWTRYRWPTGSELFNRPVRGVTDFSASYLAGDQSLILGTDWLARVGIGGEIDLSETWVPWVSTTRLMVRAYGGEDVLGYSVGLGISF